MTVSSVAQRLVRMARLPMLVLGAGIGIAIAYLSWMRWFGEASSDDLLLGTIQMVSFVVYLSVVTLATGAGAHFGWWWIARRVLPDREIRRFFAAEGLVALKQAAHDVGPDPRLDQAIQEAEDMLDS